MIGLVLSDWLTDLRLPSPSECWLRLLFLYITRAISAYRYEPYICVAQFRSGPSDPCGPFHVKSFSYDVAERERTHPEGVRRFFKPDGGLKNEGIFIARYVLLAT